MKIQLDTENKTIKIEEEVNLNELVEMVKKLLPDGEWQIYKLEPMIQNNYLNLPTILPIQPYNPSPWWEYPTITCQNTK